MTTPRSSLQFGWFFCIVLSILLVTSQFIVSLQNPILEVLTCMWLVGTTTKYKEHAPLAVGTFLIVFGAFFYIPSNFAKPEFVEHVRNAYWLVKFRHINWFLLFTWTYASWQISKLLVHLQPKANDWQSKAIDIVVPVLFGISMLFLWENLVSAFEVSAVLLPAPSQIFKTMFVFFSTLMVDFQQTFLKAVLIGYIAGCLSGFLVGIATDKVPFLQRGLLPLGNFISSLPIVGMAPIFVMWFGFDWPSKAAVVWAMTFFPMLVNTVSGLGASTRYERDLIKTYNPTYMQSLWFLRLPRALPFLFNALKINTTAALIGAIVAEFFGTPIVGMGFRISTEIGRLNLAMVWATITVAAISGSIFYHIVSLIEQKLTFWHPSFHQRGKKGGQ